MVRKGLIVISLFYLLGVCGVAGGYFASRWGGDWSLSTQLFEAIGVGAHWPLLVIELILGN